MLEGLGKFKWVRKELPSAVIYRFNRIGYYRHSAVIVLREEGVDYVCKRLNKDGYAVGNEFGVPRCEVNVIGQRGRVL